MKKSRLERQAANKVHEVNKKAQLIGSYRLNAKTAKKLRQQADFVPTDPREYVEEKRTSKKGRKVVTIRNKPDSPRAIYQKLKRDKEGRE